MKKPVNAYFLADDENKKRLVRSLMEKFEWRNENLSVCWRKELKVVAERNKNPIQGNEVVVGSATGNRTPITRMKTWRPNH